MKNFTLNVIETGMRHRSDYPKDSVRRIVRASESAIATILLQMLKLGFPKQLNYATTCRLMRTGWPEVFLMMQFSTFTKIHLTFEPNGKPLWIPGENPLDNSVRVYDVTDIIKMARRSLRRTDLIKVLEFVDKMNP